MKTEQTNLLVRNEFEKPVLVFVTFAASNPSNKCAPEPLKPADFSFLTPVEHNDLMGVFTIGAGATQLFCTGGNCFSGNICFFIEPQCPVKDADFNHGKSGTSIAEFTLNPKAGCLETIDISCVNGINSFIEMKMGLEEGWNYGSNQTPIHSIKNKKLGENSGNPGVYPVNCTTCTGPTDIPKEERTCPSLPLGPAQTEPICNVQRKERGGTVEVILRAPVDE